MLLNILHPFIDTTVNIALNALDVFPAILDDS